MNKKTQFSKLNEVAKDCEMLLIPFFIDVKLVSEHKEISKRGIKNTK